MDFTQKQHVQLIAVLLFIAVISQAAYTLLYVVANDVPRLWLWGIEGLVFVVLAAVAGAALVSAKQHAIGFSAIFVSAILNVVQVGIGLTQFGAFREAAQGVEAIAPAAASVVALSFFVYNAAKILLGVAAWVFGVAAIKAGFRWLGRLAVFFGIAAFVTNSIALMLGRIEAVPSGATGVIATLLLAVCLSRLLNSNG